MELDIDYDVAARFGEVHQFYCRNLNVFKSFLAVFERFFKKEKYQNAEIKTDADMKQQATIRFCGQEYNLRLAIDAADLHQAHIVLEKTDREGGRTVIGQAAVAEEDSVVFAGDTRVFLKDKYEFTNAALKFFIDPVTKKSGQEAAGR